MTRGDYPIQQELAKLKLALDANPTSVEAASRYWEALGSLGGQNVRSGGFVREAFRGCALASREGVIAFGRAFRGLFESTGELPRAELFDRELLEALKARLSELSGEDRVVLEWVLSSVE